MKAPFLSLFYLLTSCFLPHPLPFYLNQGLAGPALRPLVQSNAAAEHGGELQPGHHPSQSTNPAT